MALFGRESEQDKQRAQNYAQWLRTQNAFAIASAVFGLVSLIEFGVLLLGIPGIITGVIALRQLQKIAPEESRISGHRLAWIGIITSAFTLVEAAMIYFRFFG